MVPSPAAVRGEATGLKPHLFYQGKEVGKIFIDADEVGRARCSADLEVETSQTVDDSLPELSKWSRLECSFSNVKAWNKTGHELEAFPGQKGSLLILKDNPGEYEVKVLWKGKLARSIKFTVKPDGTFDDTISTTNKLGDARAIVPVQIMGDQDGKWDHDAWKTDAFYGNPLTGFTALP